MGERIQFISRKLILQREWFDLRDVNTEFEFRLFLMMKRG